MERKAYMVVTGLVAVAGLVLALHVWRIEGSMPAMIKISSRYFRYGLSRENYVHGLWYDAMLLPLLCGLFAYVAHVGREIDIVSWFFVAGFYVALWWLSWEADHAYQIGSHDLKGISVGSVSHPASVLMLAVAAGLGFWKFKQDWGPGSL